MSIVIQNFLDERDVNDLFHWSDSVFPTEGRGYSWSPTNHHVIARNQTQAIGHIGFGRFSICGPGDISVIGVGGVVVRPEWQGRYIPQLMFDKLHATDVLNAAGSLFLLFCPKRLVPYYQRLGYLQYRDGFSFLQEGEYVETKMFHLMWRGEQELTGHLKVPSNPW